MISVNTSVDDLKVTIKYLETNTNGDTYSIKDMQHAIAYEEKHQKRKSVLSFLRGKLNKKIAAQNKQSLRSLKSFTSAVKKAFK